MNKELFNYIAFEHKRYYLNNQDDATNLETIEEYNKEIYSNFDEDMTLTDEEKAFALWNWNLGFEKIQSLSSILRYPVKDEEFLDSEKKILDIFSKIDAKEVYIYSKRKANFFYLFPSDNVNSNIENKKNNNNFKEEVSSDNITMSNINSNINSKNNQTIFNSSDLDTVLRNNDYKLAFILIHKEINKINELINSKKTSQLVIDDIKFELSPLETEMYLTRKKKLLEKQAQELLTKL